MIVCIPYKNDGNNGLELKYSIRSMVKHFRDMTGVLLIGEKPDWYIGEHIPATDQVGKKEWNIVSKVLLCPHENFLFSFDDVFALKDFDSTLPLYYSGTLKENKAFGQYVARNANVLSMYPDGLFYDVHTPHVINRELYHKCQPLDWNERQYLCKSIYGNFVGGGVQYEDYKIRSITDINIDTSKQFFSTSNYLAERIVFEELYPEPSQYEKK